MDYSSAKAKQKQKQNLDIDFNVSKRTQKKIKKSVKKSAAAWVIAIFMLAVGAVGGFFAHKLAFKDDLFQMVTYANGEADITIGADEDITSYTELGVKCVAFGKDYSKDCSVTYYYREDLSKDQVKVDAVDEAQAGIYYAVYTTTASKYKKVTLIRNIIVMREEA